MNLTIFENYIVESDRLEDISILTIIIEFLENYIRTHPHPSSLFTNGSTVTEAFLAEEGDFHEKKRDLRRIFYHHIANREFTRYTGERMVRVTVKKNLLQDGILVLGSDGSYELSQSYKRELKTKYFGNLNEEVLKRFSEDDFRLFGISESRGSYPKPPFVVGYNDATGSWHCIVCGENMGPDNPRQLCGKSYCPLF